MARQNSTLRIATSLMLLLTFSVSACGSDPIQGIVVYSGDAGGGDSNQISGSNFDINAADAMGSPSGDSTADDDVETKREIIVLLNTTVPQVIGPTGILPIHIKVVDYTLGAPAGGVAVFWELIKNEGINGPGAGALDTVLSGTDANGITGTMFRANKSPLVDYTVKISCEGAEPAFVDVTVTDTPKGNIRVTMQYDNQIAIGELTVRVMPMPFTCASFKPVYPPAGYVGSKTTFLSDKPEFNSLAADKKYGLYIIGKNTEGHLAAAGCADGILVLNQQTTDVTVTIQTLTLMASGPYDMVNHFDFTGAIPGQLGQILDTAVQIFYDPGAFIIAQVKNLIKQILPSIVVDVAFSLFEDALSKVVTDWLLNKSPAWLQDFFQMGQDVLQVVKNLEMLGVLTIFKVSNDYFIKGEIAFTGLNLYWKLGCDKNDPNYATCGQIHLDASDAVNDPNFPMNFLAGTLTGTISQQVNMSIDSSTIKLNYGKLIMFVLTNVILKAITGETTFQAAMSKLVNCAGIAKGIGGSILGKLGLSESTVKGVCDSAVALLVLPIEQLIGGLALDSKLMLTGSCTMVDGNDDLKVDELIDGVWVGTIVADTPGKPFKGDFSAIRQPGF